MISVLTILMGLTIIVSLNGFNNNNLKERLLFVPFRIKHNNEHLRIISHVLIHADLTHLAFNMFSLYFLGSFLENSFIQYFGFYEGESFFLILYILGGIFATFIPYYRHHENRNYQSLGASGAVSAIVFAAILWNPTMQLGILFIPIPIPAYIFGPIYLFIEYLADKKGNSGIAHDAHIGGAIFGVIFILLINFDKGKEFFYLIFK
jgi:membrane associated rhomboid family serine protease